jgi:hypothetical protein
MNIDDLTYGQIREISSLVKGGESKKSNPFKTGENYLIRTVTMILVGRLDEVHDAELVLSSASWVADTGRFYDALKTGKLDEVEPFLNDVVVGRGALIDATVWTNELPKEQK